MICASPRNCSGLRSPRGTATSIVEKPSWRCARTLDALKRSNSVPSPLGLECWIGAGGALPSSSSTNSRCSTEKSRSATQSPSSSSSAWRRSSSIPNLSTKTLIRARARLTRSHSWRSKIRMTASVTFRYSPSSAPTKS